MMLAACLFLLFNRFGHFGLAFAALFLMVFPQANKVCAL
jgi:hypothetical protein